MKPEKHGGMYEKVANFGVGICVAITIFCVFAVIAGAFHKRQVVPDSGQYGLQSELIGRMGEFIGRVQEETGSIADGLGSAATGLLAIANSERRDAEAIRAIAKTVKDMENYQRYIDSWISNFSDYYYSQLDADIERELGIKVP
jgi:hypothetical protein